MKGACASAARAASYDLESKNALTPAECFSVLSTLYDSLTLDADKNAPAAFLLLLNALAFEDDGNVRFSVYELARRLFALDCGGGVYDALENSLALKLAELRKGGE